MGMTNIIMSTSTSTRFPDFLHKPVDEAAQLLVGCTLQRQINDTFVHVRIVEVEAYDQDDEASHAFGGKRKRNATMFRSAGHLYVYFTYGMHYCCNIVTGKEGVGSGVLIRAVEPIEGMDVIESRRGMSGVNTTNGPAKLCQALGIDMSMNGHDLYDAPLKLFTGELGKNEKITSSPRIGISKARDIRRRFFIAGNSYVSR